MATDIKRVRFFDGQFLKEGDFQAEQRYHSHLRRRMNFLLFQQSGVLPMTPADLTLEVVNAADKTFRIKAGTAIAQNLKEEEGREIILGEDSAPIDLDVSGIGAGQTAVVSLHWEQVTSDLSTEGETSQDTRFFEQAVINVGLTKPATPVATGDPYVQLGTILFDTMTITPAGREVALLRSALIATAPSPIITSVTGTTAASVGPVTMTIHGNNLSPATLVTFSDPLVSVSSFGVNTPSSLDVTINIAAGASPGPKSFQVSTAAGIGFSPAGVVFTVLQPAPTITGMVGTPSAVVGGAAITMIINGNNLTGATVSFPGAAGINVSGVVAAPGSVTFQVQAVAGATAGLKLVRVDTVGGFAISASPVGLTVLFPPTITTLTGVTSIVANSVATGGIIINGTNLFGGVVTFPTEPTMIVGATSVNVAGTQLTVTLTAPTGMTPTPKTYRVTTLAGFVDCPVVAQLGVTAPLPVPTISGISLHASAKGATPATPKVNTGVIITGTGLGSPTGVAFFHALTGLPTADVTGSALSANGAGTQLTLTITVTSAANSETYTFKVSTSGGTADSTGIPGTSFSVL